MCSHNLMVHPRSQTHSGQSWGHAHLHLCDSVSPEMTWRTWIPPVQDQQGSSSFPPACFHLSFLTVKNMAPSILGVLPIAPCPTLRQHCPCTAPSSSQAQCLGHARCNSSMLSWLNHCFLQISLRDCGPQRHPQTGAGLLRTCFPGGQRQPQWCRGLGGRQPLPLRRALLLQGMWVPQGDISAVACTAPSLTLTVWQEKQVSGRS